MIKCNAKISVLGLGKSGIACANLAILKGYKVFASDSGKERSYETMKLNKNVEVEFKKHSTKVLDSDIIIKSPGLSNELEILQQARKKGIAILSELEFALNFAKPKKIETEVVHEKPELDDKTIDQVNELKKVRINN